MANSSFTKSHNVTSERVSFNKRRVLEEMHNSNRPSDSKRGRYNLKDLANDINLSYEYLKKEIWKNGLLSEHAERIAALLGVRLDYLEGKSGIRTEKDLEKFEQEYIERKTRADNRLLSCGLEYFKLIPNINIQYADNINSDNEKEPTIGYKITYYDENYHESSPIYKTIPEMIAFLQSMNEVIEQIIKLHALK